MKHKKATTADNPLMIQREQEKSITPDLAACHNSCGMLRGILWGMLMLLTCSIISCSQQHEHVAPAVNAQDSLPFMTSHGISNLISDSGIISYKIVAEDWDIYTEPTQEWTFLKGLFLEKFDTTFHVEWHIQSDTAYCHNNKIWELRGRVVVLNREGDLFKTEELFWDMDQHLMWNTMFMTITKPGTQQQLQGYNFRSNEEMTDYHIDNSAGYTPVNDNEQPTTGNNEERAPQAENRRALQGQ